MLQNQEIETWGRKKKQKGENIWETLQINLTELKHKVPTATILPSTNTKPRKGPCPHTLFFPFRILATKINS